MSESLRDVPLAELTVDDGVRPKAPEFDDVSDAQRAGGRHLAAIHRHYLMDMARILTVLRRIRAGDAPPEALQHIVLAADMTQNLRAFGTLCGQECRALTMHHDIEQTSIFPQLEHAGNDALRAVVARLRAEHHVVHELLERLAAASHALVHEPTEAQLEETSQIFEQLETVVRSHFRYEETELAEALGVLGVLI